jgi:protein tyrosine/serine phosphatase
MPRKIAITPLHPENGAITHPLQAFRWAPDKLQADEGSPIAYGFGEDPDHSFPLPVEFGWKALNLKGNSLHYDLEISPNPDFRESWVIAELYQPLAQVWNLHVGTLYHWKVVARKNGEIIAESPTWCFTTHEELPRWIHIPHGTNVRDIGGWELPNGKRIPQGKVYRSAELNGHLQLSEGDKQILRKELHLHTDLDLRGEGELCEPFLEELHYFNVPILPYKHISSAEMVELYRKVFQILADPANYPILVHCWGGADRTGTVIFLLEALLGVAEQDLYCDYELTSLSVWGERRHTSLEFQEFLSALAKYAEPGSSFQMQAETYLKFIGISDAEINAIREIFNS